MKVINIYTVYCINYITLNVYIYFINVIIIFNIINVNVIINTK